MLVTYTAQFDKIEIKRIVQDGSGASMQPLGSREVLEMVTTDEKGNPKTNLYVSPNVKAVDISFEFHNEPGTVEPFTKLMALYHKADPGVNKAVTGVSGTVTRFTNGESPFPVNYEECLVSELTPTDHGGRITIKGVPKGKA
ncbi:hypothetical protein ACIQWR_20075 [Streptomyces sp. NPDC098789]|uniref:hypothetical protein n=1 Tax=Streptomyces sp. NPDC098789 TaxID=3366098 RepID=UPI0037F8DFAC